MALPEAATGTQVTSSKGCAYWCRLWAICLIAASGGLLFGYDLGVTGGVTGFPTFEAVLPGGSRRQSASFRRGSAYCVFDDSLLQFWTSSMFLGGAFAGLLVMVLAQRGKRFSGLARKHTMVLGGACFFVGALLQAFAINLGMLFVGRLILGGGIGFANQAVPLYISEMAPAHMRGRLNIMFQMATTIGIFAASLVNYGTQALPYGWRISLAVAMAPAAFFGLGSLCLPDTPHSMLYRDPDSVERASRVLQSMRGTADVGAELDEIVERARAVRRDSLLGSCAALFSRAHGKQAAAAILIPLFQQFTGMNAIMFYATTTFQVTGMGVQASLMSAVVTNGVNLLATLVAVALVDRAGRKPLFYVCGACMAILQVATACLFAARFHNGAMASRDGAALIACMCMFVACFAASWGPLGWTVPSEMHTLATRTAGQSLTVTVNFLASFIVGQFFNSMFCHMEFGVYLFFAAFVIIMTLWVAVWLPETRGVRVEEVMTAWATVPDWPWRQGRAAKRAAAAAALGSPPTAVPAGAPA